MNNYALITGASTGIGYELAKVAASNKYNLILVARNLQKLEEVKTEIENKFGVNVEVISADLANSKSPKQIFDLVEKQNLKVEVLINNAGFGSNGRFDKLDLQNEMDELQVNVASSMQMCHLFIPKLIQVGNGKIMNVGSIAGFAAGPYMATYYATKAFVKSFSVALNEELKGTGVTVSVLCPGATKSEFFKRAKFAQQMSSSKLMMSAEQVAQIGWKDMVKGKPITISGLSNLIIISIAKHLPETLLAKGMAYFNKSK
jgi:uncharacterized protein